MVFKLVCMFELRVEIPVISMSGIYSKIVIFTVIKIAVYSINLLTVLCHKTFCMLWLRSFHMSLLFKRNKKK